MNVVYMTNYIDDEIINIRNNRKIMAQPANNKILLTKKALESQNYATKIFSTGLTNSRSFKFYKGINGAKNSVYYIPIIDIPIINIVSSIIFAFIELWKLKKQRKLDYIIFWNYKPEVAIPAFLAKFFLNTKIIVDYQDGYFALKSIHPLKRLYFNLTEKIVSKWIDGSILVSSNLKFRIPSNKPYIVINGIINEAINDIVNTLPMKTVNKIPVLMYSGGLDNERGIDILLNSLKHTKSEFKLYVSGKGIYERLVEECEDERVEYLGFLDYHDLIQYLYNSDILINPQKTKNTFGGASFPSKIYDYLPTQNMIISSNIDEAVNIFGESLYYFYDDNERELANIIDLSIGDLKNGLNKEKIEGINKLNVKYSYTKIGEKIVQLLKRVN